MDDETLAQDDLDERVRKELSDRFPSAPFPESAIQERIRATLSLSRADRIGSVQTGMAPTVSLHWWQGSTARTAVAVAASLALFIGGVEYGRRTAMESAPQTSVESADALMSETNAALSIQDAGSRYVASLARFSGEAGSLSPDQRRVAREVAMATIYAATLELLGESEEDETLRTVVNMVATRREQLGTDTISATRSY